MDINIGVKSNHKHFNIILIYFIIPELFNLKVVGVRYLVVIVSLLVTGLLSKW